MNEFLPERFVENVRRLALGVEPVDAMRRRRVAHALDVMIDGVPRALPRHRRTPGSGVFDEEDELTRLPRHSSCRHVLLVGPGIRDSVDLRISDPGQRFVPRRLRVRLWDPVVLTDPGPDPGLWARRSCRPALLPGAAYDVGEASTGLRGRITRGGGPMRWARAEARRIGDGVRVGVAHGDGRGEFLLLLDPRAGIGVELPDPLRVEVTVFGPDDAPDPATSPGSDVDPLWDLPVETVPLPGAVDTVSPGEGLPAGYGSRPNSSREVEFRLGRFVSESFDFS